MYKILVEGETIDEVANLAAARDAGRKYLASAPATVEVLVYTTSPYAPICRIHWDDDDTGHCRR